MLDAQDCGRGGSTLPTSTSTRWIRPRSPRLRDVARYLVGHGHKVICEVQHLPHHWDHLLGAATKHGYGEDRDVVTHPKIRWAVGTPIASVNAAPGFGGMAQPGDCQRPTRW